MDNKTDKKSEQWLKLMEIGRRTRCHQIPDRSFFINGFQFPVCSRCTGVISGWIISIILIFFYMPSPIFILSFCAIMFMDWFLQYKNILSNNNIRRFITGTMGGYALMSLYLEVIIIIVKFVISKFQ